MTTFEQAPTGHVEVLLEDGPGPRLFQQSWYPEGETRAAIAIVHGLGEHGGRYAPIADVLTRRGYAVHAIDLRGHGRSDGPRVNVETFGDYLDDLRRFLESIARPGVPLFILGQALGGGVVTLAAVTRRLDVEGVILASPAVPAGSEPDTLRSRFLSVAGKILPKLGVYHIDSQAVSRDQEVVKRYEADPLVYHGRLSAGFIGAYRRALERIEKDTSKFNLPVLILHGTGDTITSPDSSRRFRERISSEDATLRLYDGLFHEVLNDREAARVIHDIIDWLEPRTTAARARQAESPTSPD